MGLADVSPVGTPPHLTRLDPPRCISRSDVIPPLGAEFVRTLAGIGSALNSLPFACQTPGVRKASIRPLRHPSGRLWAVERESEALASSERISPIVPARRIKLSWKGFVEFSDEIAHQATQQRPPLGGLRKVPFPSRYRQQRL